MKVICNTCLFLEMLTVSAFYGVMGIIHTCLNNIACQTPTIKKELQTLSAALVNTKVKSFTSAYSKGLLILIFCLII